MYLKMSVLFPKVMGWDWDQCLGSSSENSFQVGAVTHLITEIILNFVFIGQTVDAKTIQK
jgi:hypothetical protein